MADRRMVEDMVLRGLSGKTQEGALPEARNTSRIPALGLVQLQMMWQLRTA